MAAGDFLTIASVAVPVPEGEPSMETEEVGAMERAFNGDMRSSVRARKSKWAVTTKMIPRTDADTLRTALEGTPPLTATGLLPGSSTSVYVSRVRYTAHARFIVGGTATEHVIVQFDMLEA